jgi:HD superfamily phosphohydrolase YqeK
LSAPAPGLSPVVLAAARGELPEWTQASAGRRAHMARVAALLSSWAEARCLPSSERDRWVAAGWLHDALRDAPPDALRGEVPSDLRDLPDGVLHGPAAAQRLANDADPELLDAIRYHTIGHPSLSDLGRALYLADFLEPGRNFEVEWRAALAARMPHAMSEVLREVIGARIRHLIDARKPIRPETAAFWSVIAGDG